jgi:hypothetical protein
MDLAGLAFVEQLAKLHRLGHRIKDAPEAWRRYIILLESIEKVSISVLNIFLRTAPPTN